MFDPSKINLNLDDNGKTKVEKENKDTLNEQNKKISSQETTIKEKENQNASEKLEKDSVLNDAKNHSDTKKNEKSIENKWEKDNNTEDVWKTEYEKEIAKKVQAKKELNKKEKKPEKNDKIVFDINLNSIDVLLILLIDKKFDFATFEPSDNNVKVTFRKNKAVKEVKYIKYPIYSKILLKAKALTKLTIEETDLQQEWKGETRIRNNMYKVTTKVVPTDLGSKLFIKTTEIKKKISWGPKKKMSLSKIFTILWAIAFIALVIWWAFIGFIVLNAKTVDDVKFFYSLWINLNDINHFLWQALAFTFSVIIFIETTFLIVYLFKFFLTKKEFKQKKIRFWILAAFILILAFWSGSAWMYIDKKLRELPNWQEMAYWDVQIYDNSKLQSESFSKWWSLLKDTSNLIWPVDIKFDLSFYADKEKRQWLTIKKFIWDFWDWEIYETPLPTIIHKFEKKWNHEVKLNVEQLDLYWKVTVREVENIPNINVSYAVIVNEKILSNWWKLVDFDATSLDEMGKIEWYFMENLNEPVWTNNVFRIGKPIFEETLIWMYIRNSDKESEELDKIFIINWKDEIGLDWNINYERWIINDLEFELWLDDLQNDFWNGYIEEYKWLIWEKEITKVWDIDNPVEASKISYKFDWYWEKEVNVTITDSAWETKTITKIINIPKKLSLSKPLKIYNDWVIMDDVKYEPKLYDYYIDQIGIPTTLKLDARFLRSNNLLYTLKKVSWDYNSDLDIDEVTKTWEYRISVEGNHTITVHYEFANRKIPDDIVKVEERIFIEWIKKEAILDFVINKNSDYVPVTVWFDASTSQVKDDNIEKFIWDYGDGIQEEKDSIVQWHKYTSPWDYDVKLKVITTSWKEYTFVKKLILKPKPQSVKISSSMKSAPVKQWIDFSSDESEWQIVWYYWNFWDWNTSTEANPTHSYKQPWEYEVFLKLDFSNKNVLEDIVSIKVYEEE